MPTLSQLEYIIAVDRLRHFVRAAEACHVSQPSLSMQIRKAERAVGFAIFDRLKKPVEPTEKGRRFIEQAKTVLREHERLIHLGKAGGPALRGMLRLGVIPTLAPYVVPRFLGAFSAAYPGVELRLEEWPTAALLRGLREDTLDAGLAATPLDEPALEERLLLHEPFHLYAGKGHPLLARGRVRPADLREHGLWLLADGHCLRTQVRRLCASRQSRQVLPNVVFEGGTLETLRQLVRHGGGATLVPELFVRGLPEEERTACVRPFAPPAPSRRLSLIYRRGHWKMDLLQALETGIRSSLPEDLRRLAAPAIRVIPVAL